MNRVLIIEDDFLVAQEIQADILDEFGSSRCEVVSISTEAEFIQTFSALASQSPISAITLDVMIRWSDPDSAHLKKTEEALLQGYYNAGMRCLKAILEHPTTSDTPVIIHTNLSREDAEQKLHQFEPKFTSAQLGHVRVIPKSGDRHPLLAELHRVLDPA